MVVVVVPSTTREVWQGAVALRRISPCLPAKLARTENKKLTKLAMMSISIEGYVAYRCKQVLFALWTLVSGTITTSQVTQERSGKGAAALRRISPLVPPHKTGGNQKWKKNEA